MQTLLSTDLTSTSVPLWLVADSGYAAVLATLAPAQAAWARAQAFSAERHRLLLLPAAFPDCPRSWPERLRTLRRSKQASTMPETTPGHFRSRSSLR